MGGKSQTAMAETLGVTRQGLNKLVVFWSNKVGVINAGMKSIDARESFRAAQLGHGNYKLNGAKKANPIGTPKVGQFLVREEQRLENMRNQFIAGKQWRKPDRQLAARRGLTDSDGQLTAKGAAWVRDHQIHAIELSGPFPLDQRFAVFFRFDVTNKPSQRRISMEEVGLFTVESGKIVREEFFYAAG
jgi:hypothetical protein